jgi:cysteinyl-tRNA synthetase
MSLYLQNTLTKAKEKFIDPDEKIIKWYTCGPTVYDKSHLGHTRIFISLDIIRRTMMYLGYDILYTMNITDIDDKIINRVQENSVYDKYISELVDEIISGNLDILDEIKLDNIIYEVELDNIQYLLKQTKVKKEGLLKRQCKHIVSNENNIRYN